MNVSRFQTFIGHEGPYEEYRYGSTLFLTSALEGSEGSASRAGRTLPPGRTRYPFTRGWVGLRAGLDRCGKSRPPPGFDPRTVQPVDGPYTDYATRFT
jgi:hypothetical protein